MADVNPTPAQSGVLDELEAEPLRQTETGIVAKKPDGTIVEVDPDGEVNEIEEGLPEPVILGDPDSVADADDYKPSSTELEVINLDDLPRAMDLADEVMILDEIQGRALDKWVYSFTHEGKLVTDLTVHGVNECVRVMNERGGTRVGVSPQPPLVEQFNEGDQRMYRAMVYAVDGRTGVGHWGMAIEKANFKNGKWDKFAQTKAMNKAERNALKKHLPAQLIEHLIAQALGQGKVQELQPAATSAAKVIEEKPVIDDDRAQELKKEIRELYGKLKELNRMAVPPGQYNTLLASAERESHERLEELRDHIASALEREEKKAEAAQTEADRKAAEAEAGGS